MHLRLSLCLPALLIAGYGAAAEPVATAEPVAAAEPAAATPALFAPDSVVPVIQQPVEAAIPFANMNGSIRDWQADGDKGIWIRGGNNKWYYATFFSPCHSVQFETAVGFMPGPTGTLDKWGALYTPGTGKCQFSSLVQRNKPPAQSTARKKAGPSAKPGPPG